jgi:hypothetical protein
VFAGRQPGSPRSARSSPVARIVIGIDRAEWVQSGNHTPKSAKTTEHDPQNVFRLTAVPFPPLLPPSLPVCEANRANAVSIYQILDSVVFTGLLALSGQFATST